MDGRYFHLSFGDGYPNVFQNAVPVLRRVEIPAVLFMVTRFIGADGERGGNERMMWDDLRMLRSWVVEVSSHSRTHVRFTELPDRDMLETDIVGSKRDIEKRVGTPCTCIAWPYGRNCDVNERSLEVIAKAGYHACFGG
jgi:peptidoglycan/xylan/chitin deacetylase (PgdA/CDA1 family)